MVDWAGERFLPGHRTALDANPTINSDDAISKEQLNDVALASKHL